MAGRRISFRTAVNMMMENMSSSSDEQSSDAGNNDSETEANEEPFYEIQSDIFGEHSDDGELFVENENSSNESFSSSEDETIENGQARTDYISPNGFSWTPNRPTPHRLQRNITDFIPGPTVTHETEIQCFESFVSEVILRTILRHTNSRVRALGKKPFTFTERACISVIIRAGADRDNLSSVESLYRPNDSRPIYRCTIGKNRLRLFLRHVTFDNKNTRRERQKTDKLAAVREMWDLFQMNLRRNYVPSESLTIDEQLYPFRGYVPGRSYMPSKPAKYGTKVFWICDAKNGYALESIPYSGKVNNIREVGLAEKLVLQLSERYSNSWRNVFMERYFSSHEVAKKLLEKGLTMTGTIKQNRREIPPCMRNVKERQLLSTKEVWDAEKRIMLISFVPKRNKNVLMISSMHSHPGIREDRKPEVIEDYNHGKGGVDVLDSRIEDFTCKRMTRKYPLIFFFLMLDVALVNSFRSIVMRESRENYSLDRKAFIKKLPTPWPLKTSIHDTTIRMFSVSYEMLFNRLVWTKIPQWDQLEMAKKQ